MRVCLSGTRLPYRRSGVLYSEDIASFTQPGVWYTVRQRADGSWECDCRDYRCRQAPVGGHCKHIADARTRVPDLMPGHGALL